MRQKTKHILILILVAILFITLYILKNLSSYVRILGCGISILLFYFSDSYFELKLLPRHYLIFILISVFGILLSPLYFIFPIYDKMLHLLNPLFYSFLIFFLINKLDIKFYQKVIITLSITISILAIFEIGEFLLDNLFDWKLQGVYLRDISGLTKLNILMDKNDDTMTDLIFGMIGSLIFVGLRLIRNRFYKKIGIEKVEEKYLSEFKKIRKVL